MSYFLHPGLPNHWLQAPPGHMLKLTWILYQEHNNNHIYLFPKKQPHIVFPKKQPYIVYRREQFTQNSPCKFHTHMISFPMITDLIRMTTCCWECYYWSIHSPLISDAFSRTFGRYTAINDHVSNIFTFINEKNHVVIQAKIQNILHFNLNCGTN